MIESGSEWFHRRTLAEVYVLDVEMIGLDPNKVYLVPEGERGPDGRMPERGRVYWREAGNFLRDYARYEPVTLELLERMGWEVNRNSARREIPDGPFSFRFIDWGDSDTPDKTLSVVCKMPYGETYGRIAPVATLRDLLQTLRVFGVSCPIPEAANV